MSEIGPRVALIINASSRRGSQVLASASADLKRHGLEVLAAIRVGSPARLGTVSDRLLAMDLDRLIVGGGDGTLSKLAPRVAQHRVALGVLPTGTANDFARTLGIPNDLALAAEVAAGQTYQDVDLARANGKSFLNVASVGMSVAALDRLSPGLKQRLGNLAYAVAGARAFFSHDLFRFHIEAQKEYSGSAHQVIVANGRFYGGGVLVAQDSTLDDGALTAYGLGMRGRWELLRTVALQKLRVPLERPGDAYVRATSLRLETWPALPVNLDGEIRTQTPVEFAVAEKALRVMVPQV